MTEADEFDNQVSKMLPMTDADVMPFGGYKGKKLESVPALYLL